MFSHLSHLMRQCALIVAIFSLVTGAFWVHTHDHAEEGPLVGAHNHTHQDHDSVNGDLAEDEAPPQGGERNHFHLHFHAHGCDHFLHAQPITDVIAVASAMCQCSHPPSLLKMVYFEVEKPPNISAA